jgi:hypothetical protein
MSSVLRTALVGLAGAIVGGLLVGGIAVASIPGLNGIIHGCRNVTTGALRVINAPTQACASTERALNWNQAGRVGPAGAPSFATTASIPASGQAPGMATATLTLGPGGYLLGGSPGEASCTVSITGGTLADAGTLPGDTFGGLADITAPSGQVQWTCSNFSAGSTTVLADAGVVTVQ